MRYASLSCFLNVVYCWPTGKCLRISHILMLFKMQLPIYMPSEAEQRDSLLYAQNVREYMVSPPPCSNFILSGFELSIAASTRNCWFLLLHMLLAKIFVSGLQMSFPDCVPLKASSSRLQDKREYHALVVRDSPVVKHRPTPPQAYAIDEQH